MVICRRDEGLDRVGVNHVQRPIHLSTQRVVARGDGHRAELPGNARRCGHERRHGAQRQPGLLRQPFRRRPADAQAGEAPRPVPDNDALQIAWPERRLLERVIDQHDDLGRVAPRALHEHSSLGARRLPYGDTRDIRSGVDR